MAVDWRGLAPSQRWVDQYLARDVERRWSALEGFFQMAKKIPADVSKVRERVKGAAGRGKAPRAKKRAASRRSGFDNLRAAYDRLRDELDAVRKQAVVDIEAAEKRDSQRCGNRILALLHEEQQRLNAANGMVEAQAKRIEELKASAPVLYVRELEAERDGLRARCQALTLVETELRQERCQRAKLAETVARAGEKAALARVEELTVSNLRLVDELVEAKKAAGPSPGWLAADGAMLARAEAAERSAQDLEGRLEFEKRLVDDARSKLAAVEHERDGLLASQADHLRQIEGLQAALAPARAERDAALLRLRAVEADLALCLKSADEGRAMLEAKIADQASLLALDPFGEVERLTKELAAVTAAFAAANAELERSDRSRLEAEGLAATAEKGRIEAMARADRAESALSRQTSQVWTWPGLVEVQWFESTIENVEKTITAFGECYSVRCPDGRRRILPNEHVEVIRRHVGGTTFTLPVAAPGAKFEFVASKDGEVRWNPAEGEAGPRKTWEEMAADKDALYARAKNAEARIKELEARQAAVEPELVEARAFREALAKFLHPGGLVPKRGQVLSAWGGPVGVVCGGDDVGGGLAAMLAAGEGA